MAITGTKRCPFCGSTNVKQDKSSVVTHAVKGSVAYGAGFIASAATSAFYGFFGSSGGPAAGKASKAIRTGILDNGSYDYTCSHCGKKFVIEYENNVITKIRKHH